MKCQIVCIVSVLVLSACAKDHTHASHLEIEGFEDQVSAFEAASQSVGRPTTVSDLIIVLSSDIAANGEDGLCVPGNNSTPIIYVSKRFWDRADDSHKEVLLFHEMGHCVLGRLQHNNATETISNGVSDLQMPESVLYYTNSGFDIPGGIDFYQQNHQQYMKELFSYGR